MCNATALDYVAPEQVLHVSSPGSGLFVPESLPPNEFVSAGDCIGSLKLDDASVAAQRQYVETIGAPAQSELRHALLTSGLDERDISQIEETQRPIREKKIFLHSDGVVEAASPERNVRSGDSLMRIRAVSMYLLRAHLPTSSFSTIPEVVRAAIHAGSGSNTSVLFLNESAKVLKVRGGPTSTEFDITFPKRAGQLPPNRSWKVILEDVKSARRVLCVPDDCVVQIGKSTEVLVHSEWGKVTPTAVTVGERANGLTEIRTGLSEGEAIVRDLHVLHSHYPNIRAIMDGFWDPSRK